MSKLQEAKKLAQERYNSNFKDMVEAYEINEESLALPMIGAPERTKLIFKNSAIAAELNRMQGDAENLGLKLQSIPSKMQ